jgi:DDE superfamily endonuclease
VGTTSAYRYITEAADVLAALAPTLTQAMKTAATKAFVILDGTLLPIDRITADRPFYSGKHKKHGMNVQVLADPAGRLLWASPALPGAVHDIRAARTHGIIDAPVGLRIQLGDHGVDHLNGVAADVSGDLLRRPAVASKFTSEDMARVVELGPGR